MEHPIHEVPWKFRDPYVYPHRPHRSGEGALNPRMSQDMPPAWGPEVQNVYPIQMWKDDVYTWNLATRVYEDRRGPLLYSQLTGVAASTIHHWLEESATRTRRTTRIKYGNRKQRVEQFHEKTRQKKEERDIAAWAKGGVLAPHDQQEHQKKVNKVEKTFNLQDGHQ